MHNLLRILILTCLIFAQSALAAYYTYDNSAAVASTYPWIDISASSATPGTSISLTNSSVSSAIPLGFTFNFGGSNYTQLQIGSNGLLFFSTTTTTTGNNTALPQTDAPNGVMLPFWDDIKPNLATNGVMYKALGSAPNRYFVVSFLNVPHSPNTGSYTFQIQIYENGNFVYRYGATSDSGASATVGVQVSATDYDQYSYNTASVANNTTILWTHSPSPLTLYHMDETLWNGTAGEVTDSSGSGLNATAVNGATTANATPAISGNPGTCGYGVFDGSNDYVALPNTFPNLTTNFTITAWIRSTNNAKSGQRILIDDQSNTGGYGFSLGDGGTGMLRFYARGSSPVILDTTNVITNNTWYFVAAVANINGGSRQIYVYNSAGTLVTSVSTASSGWGTDSGAASIGGENNASTENSSSFRFSGNLDEVQVFTGALSATSLAAIATQTHPCTSTGGTPGGFNAFETSTAATAITGIIKTKIAGSAFNLDLVALNTAKTAVATSFTGTVKVELLDSSSGSTLDSNGCNTSWPNIQTLATSPAFSSTDAGRKTVSFQENNAWPNVRVRISYPATGTPTTIGCSTDNFAIRPNAYSNISVSDSTWSTAGTARSLYNTAATGGNVHKAGQAFSMSATAVNALSTPTATSNYAGTPAAALVTCLQPASGCNLGVLNVGTWAAASGTVTTSTATYSEAGAFTMLLSDTSFASVDAADSTAAERTITSASFSTGRFVPDHFDLITSSTPQFRTFNTTDSNCNTAATAPKRRFTYIGQGFGYATTPQATLTAKNAGGATTQNYQGALWHSPIPTSSYSSTHTLDTSLTTLPVVTSNNNGTGSININASDTLAYTRNTSTPQNQFNADIMLSLNASDTSENAVTGNGTIATNAAAVFNGSGTGIAFDASNSFRYGRLSLSNANGAETLDLPVPMTTQYWNGTNFITNTDDYCTKVSANNITMQNYTKNLAACETAISLSGPFNAGKGNLKLIKPGSGNNGSVDLPVNLGATATGQTCIAPLPATQQATTPAAQSYLQGKWSGTTYDKNPTARATFGVYKNANEFIYMREMY